MIICRKGAKDANRTMIFYREKPLRSLRLCGDKYYFWDLFRA
jgi:hypothetical protein